MNGPKHIEPFFKKNECSICNNYRFIYRRRHSGQYLCAECFSASIEKIINKTISKYNLLNPNDKIIVGLSGGKDSITLLYNLKKIQEKTYNSKPLIAVSIDEGIKNYSSARIELAKQFCETFHINHRVISFKEYTTMSLDIIIETKKKKEDFRYPCNYCATIKRRLLNDIAKKLGGTVLALGHNLTDMSETYLMNILYNRLFLIARSNLLRKDSGLGYIYIEKVFPLMKIPEREIEIYAKLNNLKFYSPLCPYRKQYPILRKRVLNFLEKLKIRSPEIEFNLFNGLLELSSVLNEGYINKGPYFCSECGYPTTNLTKCRYCLLLKDLKKS